MKNNWYEINLWAALLLTLVVVSACVSKKQSFVQPVAKPLYNDVSIKQGLLVYFRYSMYRHIDEMPSDVSMISEGKAGQPVAFLNHRFEGSVFDSKSYKGIGVFLTGFLKMDTPGEYWFKAMSNDGVRVTVNGQVVAFDPTVHSDRFSDIGKISIDKPGWYPLTVKYFQRKGGARLELHWQPPGVDDFEVVPAEVFGHVYLTDN